MSSSFMNELAQGVLRIWGQHAGQISAFGLRICISLIILLAGLWLARRIGRWIKRASANGPHIDATFAGVLASTARWVVLCLAVILILQQFGVQTASVVAVLGAATLAIGLALQGTLSNVAAGVLILVLRPYKLGHVVELGDRTGVVRDITLFTTELATFDNVRVVLPNAKIIAERIVNLAYHPQRRVDLDFRIAYEDDLDRAIAVLRAMVDSDARVLTEPKPLVEATSMGEHAVVVSVWAWCATEHWQSLKLHLIRDGLRRLRAAGFRQPYPVQRDTPLNPK